MLNRRQQQLVRLGCWQSAIGTRLFAVGTRLWAIGRRHSPSCSCAPIASLRRKQKIALFMNACVLYVCVRVRVCVCAPLPALLIHCFIKGPTCTTCMSMHVSLCVCTVCCPTNDAFVVVVVFACTNYFILHMYHKHIHTYVHVYVTISHISYVCQSGHTVIVTGTSKHMRFTFFAFLASQSILPLIWK